MFFFSSKALLFFAHIFILGSCYAQTDRIVLINKNNSWDRSFFSYYNSSSNIPIISWDLEKWHKIDTSKYVVTIPSHEPKLFNFSWNWKAQHVYLFPGDTLEFCTTSNDTIPFQFGGSRPYDELMFFSLLEAAKLGYLGNSGNRGLMVNNKLNFQYVADQTFERYSDRLKFLNDRLSSGKFSDKGRLAISQCFYYRYLSELLFPYDADSEISLDNTLVPDFYKAKLKGFAKELNNDSLLYLRDYKVFTFRYARFLFFETGAKKPDLSSLINFYKKKFKGRVRDFLLSDEIRDNYIKTGVIKESDVSEAVDSIKDKAIRDTLISIQTKTKNVFSQQALKTEMETPNGEKITLSDLSSGNPQKSLYLDFWATWCGPCLMEMPDSEKLTQEFKNDSVEFIYISVDKDKQKWQKKITTLPHGKNTHHYNIGVDSNLAKEMEIPPIPRYILIAKNGQIVTSNAPRPKSPEIRTLISESILKK